MNTGYLEQIKEGWQVVTEEEYMDFLNRHPEGWPAMKKFMVETLHLEGYSYLFWLDPNKLSTVIAYSSFNDATHNRHYYLREVEPCP